MVIFNALLKTVRFSSSWRKLLQGSTCVCPISYGNTIQSNFYMKSRLRQELSTSANIAKKVNLTGYFPSSGQKLLHGSASVCPISYRNAIQSNFHTKSRLCQEMSSSANVAKKFNLSFADYLTLKSKLRMKQRIAGVPFAIGGIFLSSMVLTYTCPDMFDATPENVQLILGLDPIVFTGISGVVAGGIGYVVGTAAFKVAWRTFNRNAWYDLDARDRDFLQRLEKYRFGGDSHFEDDYYGESIKNLSDYRQWVRTHQKKKQNYEKYELTALKAKLE